MMETEFQKATNDSLRKPWERFSVAYGMSEYQKGDNVDDVFKRADESMYRKKMEIKGLQKSES
jgi:GGDEF domain-containing protein